METSKVFRNTSFTKASAKKRNVLDVIFAMISFLVLLIPGESVKTFPKFSSCHRYFSLSIVLDERHASNRFIFLGYVFLFTGDFSVYLAAFSCETIVIEYTRVSKR